MVIYSTKITSQKPLLVQNKTILENANFIQKRFCTNCNVNRPISMNNLIDPGKKNGIASSTCRPVFERQPVVIISIDIPNPSWFQSSPWSTPALHVSPYIWYTHFRGASQYPSSVLHPMSRKPIELCHLEGHLNSLTQVYPMRKSFHRKTWRTCTFSSPFSAVVIILMYFLPLQFK